MAPKKRHMGALCSVSRRVIPTMVVDGPTMRDVDTLLIFCEDAVIRSENEIFFAALFDGNWIYKTRLSCLSSLHLNIRQDAYSSDQWLH